MPGESIKPEKWRLSRHKGYGSCLYGVGTVVESERAWEYEEGGTRGK